MLRLLSGFLCVELDNELSAFHTVFISLAERMAYFIMVRI